MEMIIDPVVQRVNNAIHGVRLGGPITFLSHVKSPQLELRCPNLTYSINSND